MLGDSSDEGESISVYFSIPPLEFLSTNPTPFTPKVWGVMDVYPRTNFPDIRKKAIVKSKSGNIIVIPREGDSLARMYINLSGGATAAKDVTLAQLHEKARQIFHPYTMEFPETAWWSAYVIGQRRT